jgi:hypothetical protein
MTQRVWFLGYDNRDDLASKVAIRSMVRHCAKGIRVILLKDHELRRAGFLYRQYQVRANGQYIDEVDGRPFSTQFTFTRFLVPELARAMGIHEPVLFTDADIMLRADINDLFDAWDDRFAVMCVKHQHQPKETTKFDGFEQPRYFRKNWSSLMLMHPDKTRSLSVQKANNQSGSDLHAMLWAKDEEIGEVDFGWNHLVGYNAPNPNAKLVHFTLGTPDFPGRENDEHAEEWRAYLSADEIENPYAGIAAQAAPQWRGQRF